MSLWKPAAPWRRKDLGSAVSQDGKKGPQLAEGTELGLHHSYLCGGKAAITTLKCCLEEQVLIYNGKTLKTEKRNV